MTDTATRRCVFCVPGTQTLGRISAWEFHRRLPVSEVRSKKGKLCFWLIINCSSKQTEAQVPALVALQMWEHELMKLLVMRLKCRTVRCCSKLKILTPFVLDWSPFPRLTAEWASVWLPACATRSSFTITARSYFFPLSSQLVAAGRRWHVGPPCVIPDLSLSMQTLACLYIWTRVKAWRQNY